MDFPKTNYYKEVFKKISLTNSSATGIEFEECLFENCSFVEYGFINCRFLECTFKSCLVSAAPLTNSHVINTSFLNSKVIGVDWTRTQRVQDISFKQSQVNYSNFRFLKLPRTNIIDCEAKEVDFTETDFTNSVFTNTDFERSIFSKTNLTKTNFKGAKNYYIDTRSNIVKGACFSLPDAISLLQVLGVTID